MLPLPSIAMGLVIVALSAPVGGYDVLPDPLGWLLVVLGTAGLRGSERRGALLGLAALAAVVSVALWFPDLRDPLVGGDAALTWSASLPQLGYAVLLTWDLHQHARSEDHRAARWLRTGSVLYAVVGLAPAVVFGGGVTVLAEATYVGAGFALLLVIVLLFVYARRDWVPSDH